jgi:hypothetical protein
MPPHVAQLESDTRLLAAQVRSLSAIGRRGASRCSKNSIDDMTGAL